MMAILFTSYSILLGFLFGADQTLMALFAPIMALSLISTYYGKRDFMIISIIADAMVISQFVFLSNANGMLSLFCIAALVTPMMASIEFSLRGPRGAYGPMKSGLGKARYIYPIAYMALIASTILVLGNIPLYKIYFLGEGNTAMQILMIVAFALMFFIPLYEKNSL